MSRARAIEDLDSDSSELIESSGDEEAETAVAVRRPAPRAGQRPSAPRRQAKSLGQLRKGSDGQYSLAAPRASSVEEMHDLGISATELDLRTGIPTGLPIGIARQIGADRRRKRTMLLKQLKEGQVTLADVLKMARDAEDESKLIAGKARLKKLVEALPTVGRGKATVMIAEGRLNPNLTVLQLVAPQNEMVLARLVEMIQVHAPQLRGPLLGMEVRRLK